MHTSATSGAKGDPLLPIDLQPGFTGVARHGFPRVKSRLTILLQPVTPGSPIGRLCEEEQKVYIFIYFHNSCTRNDDHPISLTKTGNAHKERIFPPTIINTFKSVRGIETQ